MVDAMEGLVPFFKRVLLAHKIACVREFLKQGISIYYYCGFRSADDQNKLYAIGRGEGDTRKVVTNVKGGMSFHQYGLAADFVPVVGKTLLWKDDAVYDRFGVLAEALGLEWGGRFHTLKDRPHVQMTGGFTCSDMQKLSMRDIESHIEEQYKGKGLMKVLELVEHGGKIDHV